MGRTLWTDPKTGIEGWIEDDNPIYSIIGGSLHALSVLADEDDDHDLDNDALDGILEDLVGYFDKLDAGVAIVGTDANGVWPDITRDGWPGSREMLAAARIVADQHRGSGPDPWRGTVSRAAWEALIDADELMNGDRRRRGPSPPTGSTTRRTVRSTSWPPRPRPARRTSRA